jgi:Icc-related predicted phosphoesterase
MKLICISDTHGYHTKLRLPAGDVLIHSGDMTARSNVEEVRDFLNWFGSQPHPHKILVAGNHDRLFENEPEMAAHLMPKSVTYLQDTSCIVMGKKIHGSPVTPAFMDWSFNRSRGRDIARHWNMIPNDTDILITHGPAFGILDHNERGQNCGCEELRKRVQAIQPKLHVFGHLHGGFGQAKLGRTQMVNAAICDDDYRPVNPPSVVLL